MASVSSTPGNPPPPLSPSPGFQRHPCLVDPVLPKPFLPPSSSPIACSHGRLRQVHEHRPRQVPHLLHQRRPGNPEVPRDTHRAARREVDFPRGGFPSPLPWPLLLSPAALTPRGSSCRLVTRHREAPTDPPCPLPPPPPSQTTYMLLYGELPVQKELKAFEDAVLRHSSLPEQVVASLEQLPHDSHPMAVLISGITALSCLHPEQNPAYAGGSIYRSAASSIPPP